MGEKQCPGRGRKEDAWQGRPLHTTMKRVKVHLLEDNGKWDDQGTGHVTIDYIKASREFVLAVVDEEDNDTLLLHNITPDDIYRKQEETVISWRDPEKALELALSFQEAEGCSIIWENMRNIREDLQSKILRCKSSSSVNGELKELPPLEMSSLSFSLKRDFPPKIVNLFTTCEDLEDRDGLHLMQTHRAFLKDHADLKEATPTRHASVVSKIHQRYRIRCIKDFWFNACLVLMIAFMFLPSTEAREVTRISECTNHNLLSRKISAACMTIQPLPICCELLVSAMDSKGCLCKLINDGTQVDIFLKKYIPCGGQHPNFVEETKNCSSLFPTKPAPSPEFVAPPPPPEFDAPPPPPPPEAAAPTPEVAAPTPEVAPPTPDKPSKSKIHWLLLVLIIVAVAGLLIFVCVELRKWKDAGRVAPNAPQQCELTATVIPNKRQTADVMIRNQALEIPINDAVPFLPLTRGRLNSARQ